MIIVMHKLHTLYMLQITHHPSYMMEMTPLYLFPSAVSSAHMCNHVSIKTKQPAIFMSFHAEGGKIHTFGSISQELPRFSLSGNTARHPSLSQLRQDDMRFTGVQFHVRYEWPPCCQLDRIQPLYHRLHHTADRMCTSHLDTQ